MGGFSRQLRAGTALVAVVAACACIAGTAPAATSTASSSAFVVQVVAPDGSTTTLGAASAPGSSGTSITSDGISGLALTVGPSQDSVAADSGGAQAQVEVGPLSVFGGELTLTSATAQTAVTSAQSVTGSSDVQGVTVLGAPADPGAGPVAVADWGVLTAGESFTRPGTGDAPDLHGRFALHLHLTQDHDGIPAGTDVYAGYAGAAVGAPSGPPSGGTKPPPTTPVHTGSGHTTHHHQGGTTTGWKFNHGQHRHHRTQHQRQHPLGGVVHSPVLAAASNTTRARAAVILAAAAQVGWPYIWGGESRSEGGFDCSGLVDYAYGAAGFPLPGRPTAAVLWELARPIARKNLQPGDLVFMGTHTPEPYHVGMYVGAGVVVVASHHGAPVAFQRLADAPWDGYGTLWQDSRSGSRLVYSAAGARRAYELASRMAGSALAREREADRRAALRADHGGSAIAPGPFVAAGRPAVAADSGRVAAPRVAHSVRKPQPPRRPMADRRAQTPWVDRRTQPLDD